MSRPKPKTLLKRLDDKFTELVVVEGHDKFYCVVYDGKPINIYTEPYCSTRRYKKIGFANRAPAYNLASRMNAAFHTNKFQVVEIDINLLISEHFQC